MAACCLLGGVLPHDGGAAFGRDDGVDGVLEHEDAVGDCERERAAGAAFAGDGGDGGDAEAGHFEEVAGDGFGLAALFGTEAGVGSGAVDEGEDGAVELLGDLHGAEGLAVAFGVGRAELAGDALFDGAAFEIGDDHDGLAVEAGHAGSHCGVVGELTITVNLAEVGEESLDVVHGIGTLGMPGQFGFDPGFGNRWCGLGGVLWGGMFCHLVDLDDCTGR